MLKNKDIILVNIFYLMAFSADAVITSIGINTNRGVEGNPVVVWLWSMFGQDSLLLKVIYILLIFFVSYLIYKRLSKFMGLVIPSSLGVGHVLGFCTWVFLYNNEFNSSLIRSFHSFLVPSGLYILSPILGICITYIIRKFWQG